MVDNSGLALDLPRPDSSVPLRDGPRFSSAELAQIVGPGIQVVGGPPGSVSSSRRPSLVFDPEELLRRNQQILIDRAKRRAGIE